MKKKLFGIFLAVCFLAVGAQAQTKVVAKTSKSLKVTTTVTRKNSLLHVLSNLPKMLVAGARVVTDTGEYVSGKIYAGFQKVDAAADEYIEGQTQ